MNPGKKFSFFFIGLALFSMFFGSGNLIFPLYVGQQSEGQFLPAAAGFLLAAVAVPFLGVLAMIVYEGDYTSFFGCLGKKMGFIITAILLTVWIPLGSGPRCIALAHSSLSNNYTMPPLWLFSLGYCALTSFVMFKKTRMLDILGYCLTPALIGCLTLITMRGLNFLPPDTSTSLPSSDVFFQGLQEGYNTMDLIAAFFFSASIIEILKNTCSPESNPLKIAFQACVVGITLLAIVYLGLVGLGAIHTDRLIDVPKDQLLAHIAKTVLGPEMTLVAVTAIVLACFTTSVALVVVYSEFLMKTLFKNTNDKRWGIYGTLLVSFVMSIFGLSGITFITAPVLQFCYPLLIVMIVVNLSIKMVQNKFISNQTITD